MPSGRSPSPVPTVQQQKPTLQLLRDQHEAAAELSAKMLSATSVDEQQALLEQMKGRLDRPGQERRDLELSLVFAEHTVEKAEAENVHLCGTFFRQYLDPLSRAFQLQALEAAAEAADAADALDVADADSMIKVSGFVIFKAEVQKRSIELKY